MLRISSCPHFLTPERNYIQLDDLLWERAGGIGWEGEGAGAGVGAVGGKRDAGAALDGVDRLVFSRLKPTSSTGRAGGGGRW